MSHAVDQFPGELRLSFMSGPSTAARTVLGEAINAFHARTVPRDARRFALLLQDENDGTAGGLSGVVSWQWLFVEALWVADAWRGRGVGSALLAQAEAHAATMGCHSVWLDTFQAREFYLARGYQEFGALDDYPPGQTRSFLRKRLVDRAD